MIWNITLEMTSIQKGKTMFKKLFLISLLFLSVTSIYAEENKKESNIPVATFAGGNFWYLQREFSRELGVMYSRTGYTGGVSVYPTYEDVSEGDTKHVEAVQLVYSPDVISYDELLNVYFENIDPLDPEGQFCHKGSQYKARIFYHTEAQRVAAEKKLNYVKIKFKGQPVFVQILPYTIFYQAEDEYQNYYKKRPFFYKAMEIWCGRPRGLRKIWG